VSKSFSQNFIKKKLSFRQDLAQHKGLLDLGKSLMQRIISKNNMEFQEEEIFVKNEINGD